jgi:predicted kinase
MASLPLQFLIGCPGSGKSFLAEQLRQCLSQYEIIATDQIRLKLYGHEATQGLWSEVEKAVFAQIQQLQTTGYGIIYDATNAQFIYRQQFLAKLKDYGITQVNAWVLQTPLELCLNRNQRRSRQVPFEIIKAMDEQIQQQPPQLSEGFEQIIKIAGDQDLIQVLNSHFQRG